MSEAAAAKGIEIEDVLWDVFQSMLTAARNGDVQAAKFLIERLCGKDPVGLDIKQEVVRPLTDTERAARIEAIFASAQRRREAEAAAAEFLG